MPTQAFGVYDAEETAGTEVSSTYKGRHVTILETELVHPSHADGLVDKGDPIVFGTVAGNHGVGVAFTSAAAATNYIALDTEGIWNLSVVASDDAGNSLVTGGDPLFINSTTCVISKIRSNASQIPFGYALGQVAAGDTAVIAVKVHWDPRSHWLEDDEMLYFGDARDVSVEWDGSNLEMLPLVDDTGIFEIGNGTLSMDVQIFGKAAAEYLLWDSSASTLDLVSVITGAATENAQGITVADEVAGAGLLGRGLFIDYDNNGIKTGAQAESNGLGINMDADADVTGLFGINVYTAGLTGATINRVAAYTCYLDDPAATVNAISCIHLETAAAAATTCDYISMRSHALQDGILTFRSGGDVATYFLVFDPAIIQPCVAFNAAGNGDYSIKCYINGETTYLHTYDAP